MNDRHPSGTMTTPATASAAASAHQASYGGHGAQYGDFTTYDTYPADGFDPAAQATSTFAADPLFGDMPAGGQGTGSYDSYDSSGWSTGGQQAPQQDQYAAQQQAGHGYDSAAYDNTAWTGGYQQLSAIPPQATAPDASGQWEADSWLRSDASGAPADATQHWEWGTQSFETGAYDATQWNTGGGDASSQGATGAYEQRPEPFDQQATATFEQHVYDGSASETSYETSSESSYATSHGSPYEASHDDPYENTHGAPYGDPNGDLRGNPHGDPHGEVTPADGELASTGEMPAVEVATADATAVAVDGGPERELLDEQEEFTPAVGSRTAARGAGRSRRRTPPKRSALMTIAVPSACVMGVAGIAAASLGTLTGNSGATTASASDATSVQPSTANNKLDTQIKSLSAGADDFADRASRTQERIDLKAEQAAEKKKAAAEAARKERLRPKYVLPVTQRGLSAYFGQAGVNWMSVHTGIDFPVSYGTTVMAATDGVVSTKWNSAYGNMLVLTEKDGTETWYCHLSSYRVASGTTVQAGQPIAYSGNSGNSTGPHLHFEVRPAGGSAIDPLPWLRSHGLDPT